MQWIKDVFTGYWNTIRPFDGTVSEYVITGLMILLTLVIIAICLAMLIALIDWVDGCIGSHGHHACGTIVDKDYTPASTAIIMSGKTLVPVHHAESWSVDIEVEGAIYSYSVSRLFYKQVHKGDVVDCEYSIGRFLHNLHLDEVCRAA